MRKIILFTVLCLIAIAPLAMAGEFENGGSWGQPAKSFYRGVFNDSSTALTVGMVVVADLTAMAYTTTGNTQLLAVTTTTSTDVSYVAGVVVENSIATQSYGVIQTYGYCAKVFVANSSDSANIVAGSLLGTSASAGKAGLFANDGDGNVSRLPFGYAVSAIGANGYIPCNITIH